MTTESFISFKNVGFRQFEQRYLSPVSQSVTPIGIKTPVSFGNSSEGLFAMNYTLEDQINDNLKSLIKTNHGERIVLYDYGANLQPLATEYSNKENYTTDAMERINTCVAKYMPFVQLEGFRAEPRYNDNQYVGVIDNYLVYSVPRVNINSKTLVVRIFAI